MRCGAIPTAPDRRHRAADNNLLASWYVAEPSQPGPPTNIPQPAGGGDRNAVPLYDFPNQRVVNHLITGMPLRVSALRTLGAYANVFAVELFMDELAARRRAGSGRFRLAHLSDPRASGVIDAVTRRAGWKVGREGRRHARTRHRLCQVQEPGDLCGGRRRGRNRPQERPDPCAAGFRRRRCGPGHQPRRAGEPDRGRHDPVDQLDLARSRPLRPQRHHLARLERLSDPDHAGSARDLRHLARSTIRTKPLGAGEASQGPMAAAIANAFANATGRRLRDLPFTPERVQAALG